MVCTAFAFLRSKKPSQVFKSISTLGVNKGRWKTHSAPDIYTWSQCQEQYFHLSTLRDQFCFLFISLGTREGVKKVLLT